MEYRIISNQELEQVLSQHHSWLSSNGKSGVKADLSYTDFEGRSLIGAKLQMVNLEQANMKGAVLLRAHLQGANLQGANLQGAILQWANLQKVNLKGANIHEANMQGANLQEADIQEANFQRANLQGAVMLGVIALKADFREANLQRAILHGINFFRANFENADLQEADLQGADLQKANLQGASLSKANLREANFTGANFKSANIRGANTIDSIGLESSIIALEFEQNQLLNDQRKLSDQEIQIKQERNLKREIQQHTSTVTALEQQLAHTQNVSEEERKRIGVELDHAKLEREKSESQLKEIAEENEQLKTKLDSALSEQIQNAIGALKTALTNTDEQICTQKKSAMELRTLARKGLLMAVCTVLFIPFVLLPIIDYINPDFLKTSTAYFGRLSIIFYTFPVIVLLLAATALLRHEQKIMAEIRHFSDQKHAIELYAGLLKAAQHAAANIKDPERAEKYVEETFSMIRKKILDGKDEDTKLDPVAQADQDKQILGTARDTLRLVSDVARLVKTTKSS